LNQGNGAEATKPRGQAVKKAAKKREVQATPHKGQAQLDFRTMADPTQGRGKKKSHKATKEHNRTSTNSGGPRKTKSRNHPSLWSHPGAFVSGQDVKPIG